MNRIGIFVDTCDLYHKVKRIFGRGNKVRFDIFTDLEENVGSSDVIVKLIAYGMRSDSQGFSKYLQSLGFTINFKSPRIHKIGDKQIKICDWNVTLVFDVLEALPSLDTVVIGSSNGLLLPLIKYLKSKGVYVIVIASGIPESLAKAADEYQEIVEEDLESSGENT